MTLNASSHRIRTDLEVTTNCLLFLTIRVKDRREDDTHSSVHRQLRSLVLEPLRFVAFSELQPVLLLGAVALSVGVTNGSSRVRGRSNLHLPDGELRRRKRDEVVDDRFLEGTRIVVGRHLEKLRGRLAVN